MAADQASCTHKTLRLSIDGLVCADCDMRIDDDMSPVPGDPRADLRTVHQIDQAHADANTKIDALVERFHAWRREHPDAPADDATQNPMAFYAIVQLGQTRIDMNYLPYLLAAAVMRIAKLEIE